MSKRSRGGHYGRSLRDYKTKMFTLYGPVIACHYCLGNVIRDNATVDHIIPASKGNRSDKSNWVICCNKCNQEKRTLSYDEFVARKERQREYGY